MKISLEFLHTCVALVLWSNSVISGPVQTSSSPAIVLIEITSELEAKMGNLQDRVFGRDEDASKRPQFVFPGISNILLGVITGDLRRIVEDGAFHFLSKGARDQAVSIYRNLIGNRAAIRNTTMATTTTSKTKSTSAVEDPDEVEGTDNSAATEDPDEGELVTEVTTIQSSRFSRRTRRTRAPVAETTARSYSGQEPDEEEEELVSRFEKALRPYLPSNPQDAVIQDYPEIVGNKPDVAA